MIRSSAPAKIHLIGEYSAIFGKPTILFPINLKLEVSLQQTKSKVKKEDFQKALEAKIKKQFNKKVPNYSLKISSNIPRGSGVGSSSALSAALTHSILKMLKIKATKEQLFEIAKEGDRIFHGFPSGSDVLAIILGKIIWYRKENQNLTVYKTLDIKIPSKLELFLINSGAPAESTKQMVEYVLKKVPKGKSKDFADAQEELTKKMYDVLAIGDLDNFKKIINEAHKNLQKLGVISKSASKIISQVESIGGAGKITGAGGKKAGSGMIIAYHQNPEKLKKLAGLNGWEITPIKLAKEGVI